MVDFINKFIKITITKEKGLTCDELVKNVKDVLDEIPITHLTFGSSRRKPKKYLDYLD